MFTFRGSNSTISLYPAFNFNHLPILGVLMIQRRNQEVRTVVPICKKRQKNRELYIFTL